MGDSNEQELLNGARAFDQTTLGVIYDRYSPGIYRYALRLTGDECQAEDCLAETFMRLLKALHAGQGPRDHLQAYLYRIAHNWITDYYRRNRREELPLSETVQDGRPDTASAAEENITAQQVRSILMKLTPDQRQVVLLKYYEGWENEEIASALNKPTGAIKSLQHRAIQRLKKMSGKE